MRLGQRHGERVARTFVWCRADDDVVVGYYSLAGHRLVRDALPKSIGRGSLTEVPAVLLARLAVASSGLCRPNVNRHRPDGVEASWRRMAIVVETAVPSAATC